MPSRGARANCAPSVQPPYSGAAAAARPPVGCGSEATQGTRSSVSTSSQRSYLQMRTASTPRFSWAPRTKQRSRSSGRDASTSSAPVWAEVRAVRVGVARDGTGASTSGSSAHRGASSQRPRPPRAAAARARRARRLEAPVLGRRSSCASAARHHRGVRARGDAELGRPPPLAARRAAVGNLRREVGVDVELVHVQPGLALEPRAHLGLAALPAERRAVPAARRVGRAKRRRRRRRRRGGGGRAGGGDGVEAPFRGSASSSNGKLEETSGTKAASAFASSVQGTSRYG